MGNDTEYDLRTSVWRPHDRRCRLKTLASHAVLKGKTWREQLGRDNLDITYSGDSCVVDYEGNLVSELEGADGVVTVELSANAQRNFR